VNILEQIQTAVSFIRQKTDLKPVVGVVLGSGLGTFAQSVTASAVLSYSDIPHFPVSSVSGHAGQMILGHYGKVPCVLMCGRVHYYEGYKMPQVVFPVRVLAQLGIKTLIVTNASGGINLDFHPGDLMVINDHINLTSHNPLQGANVEAIGPRFPDMTEAYAKEARAALHAAAEAVNVPLREGVYAGVVGPSYETPAEIRMLRMLGADAVGMSTVSEVIAARHAGVRVAGLSVITNYASGVTSSPLSHADVTREGEKVKKVLSSIVGGAIERLS
jgi:purine-nucleoside phosphorylase